MDNTMPMDLYAREHMFLCGELTPGMRFRSVSPSTDKEKDISLTMRQGNEVHHYTYDDFDNVGRQALARLLKNINKEGNAMEMTAFELEALAAEKLDREFWAIIENNGLVRMSTKREAAFVTVRKAPRHPGHYLVTAA
jgi:hypothetical protein